MEKLSYYLVCKLNFDACQEILFSLPITRKCFSFFTCCKFELLFELLPFIVYFANRIFFFKFIILYSIRCCLVSRVGDFCNELLALVFLYNIFFLPFLTHGFYYCSCGVFYFRIFELFKEIPDYVILCCCCVIFLLFEETRFM